MNYIMELLKEWFGLAGTPLLLAATALSIAGLLIIAVAAYWLVRIAWSAPPGPMTIQTSFPKSVYRPTTRARPCRGRPTSFPA